MSKAITRLCLLCLWMLAKNVNIVSTQDYSPSSHNTELIAICVVLYNSLYTGISCIFNCHIMTYNSLSDQLQTSLRLRQCGSNYVDVVIIHSNQVKNQSPCTRNSLIIGIHKGLDHIDLCNKDSYIPSTQLSTLNIFINKS